MKFTGIDLPDGERMKTVSEYGYKYLGVLEFDDVLNDEMKVKLKVQSGKNTVRAIISWAVSVMRYGAGIINWTKGQLETLDRKTRKLLTVYGMFHPCSDVDRTSIPHQCGYPL